MVLHPFLGLMILKPCDQVSRFKEVQCTYIQFNDHVEVMMTL